MNVADVGRALLRHPVWLVVGIVLAVVAGGATFSKVAPEQQSTASLVILPPAFGDQVTSQNPYLNLDNTLAQLATIVGSALTSGRGQQALAEQGATAAFTITNTTSDNPSFAQLSPELVFTVTDPVAQKARFTAERLVAEAAIQLDALQDRAQVPAKARARAVTVSEPSQATLAGDGQIRAGGGVGLIVLVLAAAAIVLLDAAVSRRRRRRQLAADVRRPRIERPTVASDADRSRTRS
ncbi:hypothetical protein ACXR2U_09580 [Jatrophihabitans sp. YIM 134969]